MITLANSAAISKAKIETLDQGFQARVKAWWQAIIVTGIIPYIYEGLRSEARQHELYLIGRETSGKIVTNADSGQSFHNYGFAFDWVPLKRVVKADNMYEADWDNDPLYAVGADIGKRFEFRAVSWETPHLEDARFENWRELKSRTQNS